MLTGIISFLEAPKIYAIVETGGKQYKVTPGQTIDVEHLDVAENKVVELDKVLLIADGDKITTGSPIIDGAKVLAIFQEDGRSKKIIVLKYKPKIRYRKKTGHRQLYTRLTIDKIMQPGEEAEVKPVKRARRTKKEVTTDGA